MIKTGQYWNDNDLLAFICLERNWYICRFVELFEERLWSLTIGTHVLSYPIYVFPKLFKVVAQIRGPHVFRDIFFQFETYHTLAAWCKTPLYAQWWPIGNLPVSTKLHNPHSTSPPYPCLEFAWSHRRLQGDICVMSWSISWLSVPLLCTGFGKFPTKYN